MVFQQIEIEWYRNRWTMGAIAAGLTKLNSEIDLGDVE